jgi:SPP1 gp7 family putative phage head morphogenesis protein
MAKKRRRRRRNRRRPPLWLFPRILERRYIRALREVVVGTIKALVREKILPALPGLVEEASPGERTRQDAWPEEVAELQDILEAGLEDVPRKAGKSARSIAIDLSGQNRGEFRKIMKATIGVTPFAREPWFRDTMNRFIAENTSLITKMNQKTVDNIGGAIRTGLQRGERIGAVRERVLNQVDVSFSRAQLIARDQVSKFNGQLTQKRQQDVGIEFYIWRTSRDERVRGRPGGLYAANRPTHWALEGKRCSWDDPTVWYDEDGMKHSRASLEAVELHPGQDFQCRCTPEPDVERVLAELEAT